MGAPDADAVYAKAEIEAGDSLFFKGLGRYRNAGKRLAKKRDECKRPGAPHYRKWLEWLEENGIKQQRANECIRLFEGWGKLPHGGNFSLKAALAFISSADGGQGEHPAKGGERGSSTKPRPGESKDTDNAAHAPETARASSAKAAERGAKGAEREGRGYEDDGSDSLVLGTISKEVSVELFVKLSDLMDLWGCGSSDEAGVEAIRYAHREAMKCRK